MSDMEINKLTEDYRILLTTATRNDSFRKFQEQMRNRKVTSVSKELLVNEIILPHQLKSTNQLELDMTGQINFKTWAENIENSHVEEKNFAPKSQSQRTLREKEASTPLFVRSISVDMRKGRRATISGLLPIQGLIRNVKIQKVILKKNTRASPSA